MHELLLERGVQNRHITILSADGSDLGADLAVREVQAEQEFWRLSGTRLEKPLRNRIKYKNSQISGATLGPATQASIRSWFETEASRLPPGDTLLLYVTDHGRKGKNDPYDPLENTITLWGKDEDLTVAELRVLIGMLDPGVSVVALMSQCFSGAFANLMYALRHDVPRGNICGFFSATEDRRAYGCYPENRDKDNVGHSFRFIEALGSAPNFAQAHSQVLVGDHTPDVPLKTSDLYLVAILRAEAGRLGEEFESLVDGLLRQAWSDKGAWEPEIRLLDRMGTAFGYFSPRFLSELDRQSELLSQVAQQLNSYGDAWRAAQQALNRENLRRFLLHNPHWDEQLSQAAVAAGKARPLAAELLTDLADHTRNDPETAARMGLLREKAEATQEARYRMQVREGVVLRMRLGLIGIAGRVYLAHQATDSQRQPYGALVECEALTLTPSPESPTFPLVATEPFPSYEEELRLAEAALPGWMGIRFRRVSADRREGLSLEAGAVSVVGVYEDSPAQEAGLVQGDIIVGPPSEIFVEAQRIREWVMTATIGKPQPLLVRRGEERIQVSLTPRPYPRQMPELPGPPQIGSPAPLLDQLQPLDANVPLQLTKGPHLLFFWATWCGPCKAALPEIAAFQRARGIPVIAITDETPQKLEAFFQKYQGSFPELVAADEFRHSFVAYGVSATPTFVLIDGEGKIESISKGYRKGEGLPIAGWSWAGPDKDSGEH